MKMTSVCSGAALLVTAVSSSSAFAAPSLTAFAGVVGVTSNGAPNCRTYGPAPDLLFFQFRPQMLPLGGIAACGYSGELSNLSAATGPLTNSRSLVGVPLGSAGVTFNGSANATASYKSLGAAAHANISGGIADSPSALFESAGAALFSDQLTATSPFVAAQTAGSVRYRFHVDGSVTSLGASGAFLFGATYVQLDIQQNGGSVFEVMNAQVARGGMGTISGQAPPAGWATSTGSLSGGSDFFLELPMTWAQQWDLKAGLMAWAYGTADSDFLTTAKITGLELFDANHNAVAVFSVSSASGTDYVSAVPEPGSVALMLAGLAGLALRRLGSLGAMGEETA